MKTGTSLTLSKMEELYEASLKEEVTPTAYIVSHKMLETLKKKYPKEFKKWLKEQEGFECSWSRQFDK